MSSKDAVETVACPQCSGRGWRFPGFMESPKRIWSFTKHVFVNLWRETVGFHKCRACDGKKAVPKEWLEE